MFRGVPAFRALACALPGAALTSPRPRCEANEDSHVLIGGVFHIEKSRASQVLEALNSGQKWYHSMKDHERDAALAARVPLSKRYGSASRESLARASLWRLRYVGTKIERSPRAKLCMSDNEIISTAKLINDLVDLSFFDEFQEQEIFEFSVVHMIDLVSERLPNEFIRLVHSHQVMPKEDADRFEQRMSLWLFQHAELPFLDESDRHRVIRCVMAMLMRSMRRSHEEVRLAQLI